MFERNLKEIWEQLKIKKSHFKNFLDEIKIENLRGIRDLRISLDYPVSVVAGPNACGKTTVLFALACAYKSEGLTPAKMFPVFSSKSSELCDKNETTIIEIYYLHNKKRLQKKWKRAKRFDKSAWNKSGNEAERTVYLRTLSNLSNPSEVRNILQTGRKNLMETEITTDLLAFAHRVLPMRYKNLKLLSYNEKDLLFAIREDIKEYSEFQMSAGERAILRISKDVSELQDALVLIDEVEAGLHPFTQQQLMLELQRLALRNSLQIVVTTHSPVVLETVPSEARIFLERTLDNVEIKPAYKDIFQKAFYGSSLNKLSILCEDKIAESIILGVLDVINPKLGLTNEDILVGRDTGKTEFPQHVRALAKFNKLDNFLFVLDGDSKSEESKIRQAATDFRQPVSLIYLPGEDAPELWIWKILEKKAQDYCGFLGVTQEDFKRNFENIEQIFEGATGSTASEKAKAKLRAFSEDFKREETELARFIGRNEANKGLMRDFCETLENNISNWRTSLKN